MNSMASISSIGKRLEGKVAIITGGASGIGEVATRLFIKHGAKVVIADVQDDHGQSIIEEIGENRDVWYVHCDVKVEKDVENVVDMAISKYGKLDIMFSNAGIPAGQFDTTILKLDYENFKRVFDVNVFGAFMCAKHAARVMIPPKKGSIIFTSSIASVTYGDMAHTYLASKHAVVGLAKNLGVELGQHGIRVNCVSPFGVATPMLMNALGIKEKEKVEEFVSQISNLKGTILEAENVAQAALYLASDESKYISGMNLVIDGGYSTTIVALKQGIRKIKDGNLE